MITFIYGVVIDLNKNIVYLYIYLFIYIYIYIFIYLYIYIFIYSFNRGILWAPICGMAMAELIAEGVCKTLNLSAFDPGRFGAGKASKRGRKMVDVDVGEQW